MVQSVTDAAQAALRTDHSERDRKAWNLPRASAETGAVHRDRLDWESFRDLYYPDTRRHNLKAIVAYGAYRSSSHGDQPTSVPISTGALFLDEWEDEGGASA